MRRRVPIGKNSSIAVVPRWWSPTSESNTSRSGWSVPDALRPRAANARRNRRRTRRRRGQTRARNARRHADAGRHLAARSRKIATAICRELMQTRAFRQRQNIAQKRFGFARIAKNFPVRMLCITNHPLHLQPQSRARSQEDRRAQETRFVAHCRGKSFDHVGRKNRSVRQVDEEHVRVEHRRDHSLMITSPGSGLLAEDRTPKPNLDEPAYFALDRVHRSRS